MTNLNELYRQKGELITTIEIAQSRLQLVNKDIAEQLTNGEPKASEQSPTESENAEG